MRIVANQHELRSDSLAPISIHDKRKRNIKRMRKQRMMAQLLPPSLTFHSSHHTTHTTQCLPSTPHTASNDQCRMHVSLPTCNRHVCERRVHRPTPLLRPKTPLRLATGRRRMLRTTLTRQLATRKLRCPRPQAWNPPCLRQSRRRHKLHRPPRPRTICLRSLRLGCPTLIKSS